MNIITFAHNIPLNSFWSWETKTKDDSKNSAWKTKKIDAAKIDAKVTDIVIKLNGATNIELSTSKDTLEVVGLKYKGKTQTPVEIKRSGNQITLAQNASAAEGFSATYKLVIPEGRRVSISAGLVNLTGNLNTKALKISAGHLTANFTASVDGSATFSAGLGVFNIVFSKCQALKVSGGNVSGSIKVPSSTIVRQASAPWQHLKIHR
ncbi:MAG: hypothetical protein ABIE74_02380 [Pseudomonadota bacterium]